jgi:PAT family beta-lactamase induction signal transducer AmpG
MFMQGNLFNTTKGRLFSFGMMYISEGIPFGFTSIALVSIMRQSGLGLDVIGIFTAALFLPWTFKWAVAPFVDIIKFTHYGGRKAWIVACTIMMLITLLISGLLDVVENFDALVSLFILHNIFAATQDVAIDALAISNLKPDERGRASGIMFGGQYLGIAIGGSGAIFIYGYWGFDVALMVISVLLFLNLLFILFFVKDLHIQKAKIVTEKSVLHELYVSFIYFIKAVFDSFWLSGRIPILALLFAFLPTGTMALAYASLQTIQVDLGFSNNEISQVTLLNTIFAGFGCVIGGYLADIFGLRKMLFTFYFLLIFPGLYLGTRIYMAGLEDIHTYEFYTIATAHGFIFGMGFAVSTAYFMGATNPMVAATQFTVYMAFGNLAIMVSNYWQGIVSEHMGYANMFFIESVIVILPLILIPFLRTREEMKAEQTLIR